MNETCSRDATSPSAGLRCPMCESQVLSRRHCKTLCTRCGYVESCEDNFLPQAGHRDLDEGEASRSLNR